MKLLTLSFLLCALLALSLAADTKNGTSTKDAEEAAEKSKDEETAPEAVEDESKEEESAPEEEKTESDADKSEKSHVAKRATSCPSGWARYGSRCFYYVGASYTWAQAERYCVARGGNLASVRSTSEYSWLRRYIQSRDCSSKMTWIGGSDAEQERYWFWSDGSRFLFRNWCSSRPSSSSSLNCLAMNYSAHKCGIDYPCTYRYPFVCVRA